MLLLASLAGSRTHSQAPAQQEMELADNFLGESSLSSLVPTSPKGNHLTITSNSIAEKNVQKPGKCIILSTEARSSKPSDDYIQY